MAVIGKNIIENLTTAMYENNNIIFREYIQNSADQIDKAIKMNLADQSELYVDIDIDTKNRCITVYDNATGLGKDVFKDKLTSIADSDKDRDEDKGFRGIGRLGGLACCDTLIFSSSIKGESVKSIMMWDAKRLRDIINDPDQRPLAGDLVDMVTSHKEESYDTDSHFFEVKLVDVLDENNELLDEYSVREYLQAVAPVPYPNGFVFRSKIYDFARDEGLVIDEYKILINGEQLFKGYTSNLYEGSPENKTIYDSITDMEFRKFYAKNGDLLAWMWLGISKFKRQIPSVNQMRGIRLRKENIQIGNSETISYPKFFKESRGNYYFVGEIFAVHKNLIPNARRDYFNINPTCRAFERSIKPYIHNDLYKLYHFANEVKNALVKEVQYVTMQHEYHEKLKSNEFIDKEDEIRALEALEKQRDVAENAAKKLELRNANAESDPVLRRVFDALQNEYKTDVKPPETTEPSKQEKKYKTQSLSKLNKQERKLVSRVYAIINAILPKDMAEMVITKIQEELSK
jgi:molecular chaperone HtpG